MRRKDRQRNEEFAWAVTEKCAYAVLSCVQPDGTPYSVPLSIAREDSRVYFHCAEEGKKIEALQNNPKVCLVCVGDIHPVQDAFSLEYESAILFGTAALVEDREEKIHGLRLISQRYTPFHMEEFDRTMEIALDRTAVWRVDVESITAKARPGLVVK